MENELESLKADLVSRIVWNLKEHNYDKAEQLSRILGNLLTTADTVVE